jgi:serine/threonine protein kinase
VNGPLLSPGTRYDRFQILAEIGRGATAAVYRVSAPELTGTAALKVTLEPAGDDMAERALREIAVLRRLTNRHVVRVWDAGKAPDGRVFILMEELEGAQLDHWHDFDEPLPAGQAAWIIHQACLGLAEAHLHGIVHRDIKPENLWIESDHNVKVLDFGLARAWDNPAMSFGANVTMTRMAIGTPHYMQPEQVKSPRLTPASDVYSLAILAYELLTGHCVHFADRKWSEVRNALMDSPLDWLRAHVDKPVVPMSRYRVSRDIPKSFIDLVMRCLSKRPERRPPTAAALANELGAILHYDLGLTPAATLSVRLPYGGHEEQLILPGSHRVGSDARAEVRLASADVAPTHALLEWSGLPELPDVRPMEGASVRVSGEEVVGRRVLTIDDVVEIAGFQLSLAYPPF